MSRHRLLEVARLDLGRHLRRPMLWILVVIITLLAWGLSSGEVTISSGDTSVGGQRAWITSQFSTAYVMSISVFIFYTFFIAVAAGMAVIRDDELKVGEVIHPTPLTPGEYVWGKLLAVVTAFVGVLGVHLAVTIVCNHILPNSAAAEVRGPFALANYLVPALVFSLPAILFVAGTSLAVGERTRRPILVFVLPLAVVMFSLVFLWSWSPGWLDPRLNRLLMLLDPAGFRWLEETWLKVDHGAVFYNTGRIGFDLPFLASRLGFILVGLGAVAYSHSRLRTTLRGAQRARPTRKREDEARAAAAASAAAATPKPLADLGMSMRPAGFLGGALEVARTDFRELLSSPGLYLFAPIILIQAFGSLVNTGALEAPTLTTPGLIAARMVNTLTLLVCLLLAFYTVESLWRDRVSGLGPIVGSSPVHSGAMLLGKALANSLVGAVILVVALIGCAIVVLVEGTVGFSLWPFLLLWGVLLLPTFLLYTAFVAAAFTLTRSRYATYGLALAVFIASAYLQFRDKMNWVGNWNLWDVVGWSDMGPLQLDRPALVLNRILALGLAALFIALAVRFYPRTEQDPALVLTRLRPTSLARGLLRLVPFLLVPLVSGSALYVLVDRGPQGGGGEKQAKDYWRQNLATYRNAPLPDLTAVELVLELEPGQSLFAASGSYQLDNLEEETLDRFPLTTGFHWKDVRWTLDGVPYEPENRTGLYVIEPPGGLAPGQAVTLGFDYHGRLPDGVSKNGGGMSEFILPCGVVLTSFSASFVPLLGFNEEIGIDEDNLYEPEDYPADFWVGQTKPLFGGSSAFTTHVTITLPAAYQANSVGVLVRDEVADGRRTVEWRSDHPVRFFNVIAGRWDVRRGQGTAVFFHPSHTYNIDEMVAALDGARRYYSEWFFPFPWQELKLSEFADLDRYAQGFPTNITFSEGIGFLTEDDPRSNTAFAVAAHESAHQWWGNMVTPGKGPGGNVLAEGLAHFSTALLLEQVRGPLHSMEFRRRIEESYGDNRRPDAERPLVEVDGAKEGDTTLMYDKGGWVFWMLTQEIGRGNALAAFQEFVATYKDGPDFPVLQDLIAVHRRHAPDPEAFDAFIDQWFYQVAVPQYRFTEVHKERLGEGEAATWEVRATIHNDGTGTLRLEVAAARGERMDEEGAALPDYRDARVRVSLGEGEEQEIVIRCDFEPDRVLPDPDVRVLQLERARALRRL